MSPACGCGSIKQPCGSCAGIQVITPEAEANRPGLPAISYRAGTYATFMETMLARLSSVPRLTTRELTDPSIALLDAWSTVADVLTFYQERIANEGYLRTATEHRSVLELARLIGYRLRPGVSSSVYLAFTVSAGFNGIISAGTRAQSMPGVGATPQPFETSDDLQGRDTWNALGPRLTRPQVITLAPSAATEGTVTIDQGTDATTRDTLYLAGISTNLKAGDALLFVSGDQPGEQALRFVESVTAQPDDKRTEVTLQAPPPASLPSNGDPAQLALGALQSTLTPFIEDSNNLFSGVSLAAQVAELLHSLLNSAQQLVNASGSEESVSATQIADLIPPILTQMQEKHDIADRRSFSRLEPWIASVNDALQRLVQAIPSFDDARGTVEPPAITGTVEVAPPGLLNLASLVDRLALAPSIQPANTLKLARNVRQAFSAESDIAPRLLAAFKPAAAQTLYKAWGAVAGPGSPIQVFAMRTKASLFGHNAPLQMQLTDGKITGTADWPVFDNTATTGFWNEKPWVVNLDSAYDQITPNSWLVVQTADTTLTTQGITFARAVTPTLMSRGVYGMSGKTTQISLGSPDNPDDSVDWITKSPSSPTNTPPDDDFQAIRKTIVYAQAEELDLAEEPLDRDIAGNTIELDGLYDGLESGRWIIVSGNRTDITDASGATQSTGVTGNELVMIASVTQGPGKQSCMALSIDSVPFSAIYAVAGPNDDGDLLVVGVPNEGLAAFLASLPLPTAANQEICSPLQLAPGLYANAYLPTADERAGTFSAFNGLLLDPSNNNVPFSGGQIPTNRSAAGDPTAIFAWRIESLASGQDTLHTTLVLANSLAYTYDANTVTLYGNVTKATHGQTQGEVIGDGNAAASLQPFPLHQTPLTYLPAPTRGGAASTLSVTVNEIEWQEADNLFELGPMDRDYITRADDSDNTTVITGNGAHGMRVPTGSANVKAVYRYGTGAVGNVAASQISQMATQPPGVKSVINPLQAGGGADGDTRDQARRNIPIGTLALDRLVSVPDYADFARTFAGIAKASARKLSDGRKLTVHLTIAGNGDVPIDPTTDLYSALEQALAQAGDPHQPLQIASRRLRLLVISAAVKVAAGYAWESVATALRNTLLDLYSFDNRDLGQSAFLSEAVSAMQATPGVQFVAMRTFDSVAESITALQLAALGNTLGLQSAVAAQLATVQPTIFDPATRIAPAELVMLTPDIPDTLILTELLT